MSLTAGGQQSSGEDGGPASRRLDGPSQLLHDRARLSKLLNRGRDSALAQGATVRDAGDAADERILRGGTPGALLGRLLELEGGRRQLLARERGGSPTNVRAGVEADVEELLRGDRRPRHAPDPPDALHIAVHPALVLRPPYAGGDPAGRARRTRNHGSIVEGSRLALLFADLGLLLEQRLLPDHLERVQELLIELGELLGQRGRVGIRRRVHGRCRHVHVPLKLLGDKVPRLLRVRLGLVSSDEGRRYSPSRSRR